jgi:hypothetical protein
MPRAPSRTPRHPAARGSRPRVTVAALDALIEEEVVDAYGESEQRTGFHSMIEQHLELPFTTEVLGVDVTVERIELTRAEEIVAVCARGKVRQAIPVLDLPLRTPPPRGYESIEAYLHPAGYGPACRPELAPMPPLSGDDVPPFEVMHEPRRPRKGA